MADRHMPQSPSENGRSAADIRPAPAALGALGKHEDGPVSPLLAADEAECLYGEAAIVLRRLLRLAEAMRHVARREPGGAYRPARERLLAAETALRQAMAALPEASPARDGRAEDEEISVAELRVVPAAGRAWYAGRELALSAKEFGLLLALAEAPTRLYSKAELLRAVWRWPAGYRGPTRTLRLHGPRLFPRTQRRGTGSLRRGTCLVEGDEYHAGDPAGQFGILENGLWERTLGGLTACFPSSGSRVRAPVARSRRSPCVGRSFSSSQGPGAGTIGFLGEHWANISVRGPLVVGEALGGEAPVLRVGGQHDGAGDDLLTVLQPHQVTPVPGLQRDGPVRRRRARVELARLDDRPAGELRSADPGRETVVVLDPPRGARLPAERGALDHQRLQALGRPVDRGAEAGRPAADDEQVDLLARGELAAHPQRTGDLSARGATELRPAGQPHHGQARGIEAGEQRGPRSAPLRATDLAIKERPVVPSYSLWGWA
jgi:hypothetical protein